MRRFGRVLLLVLQPVRPGSDLVGAVQILVTIGGPVLIALLPFLFASAWTPAKAALVILGVLAVLSLRGAYQLQADNEALLGGTELQSLLAEKIREGVVLLRRIQRSKGPEIRRNLSDEVIGWAGAAITDVNARATELGDEVLYAHSTGPGTLNRNDQMRYVKRLLAALGKIARELR